MSNYPAVMRRSMNTGDPASEMPDEATPELPSPLDLAITAHLRERLAQLGIDTASLGIVVLDGVVTLTGSVHDRMAKYQVEHIAAQIEGVVDVENQLGLALPSSNPPDPTQYRLRQD